MAFGALIIKQRMRCSDEWVVKHINENPYLQYFIGMKEYGSKCPFGASTMVAFRTRFRPEDIARILEATIPEPGQEKEGAVQAQETGQDSEDDGNDDQNPSNGGTLILDATCCPADIAYPQDINLLNKSREKLEETTDEICKENGLRKPRIYRKCAREDYLCLAKSKKRTEKSVRKAIGKQLRHIRRDIRYIVKFVQNGVNLTQAQMDRMNLITTVYEQQRIMQETHTHRIPGRIVSLFQPWIRPIVLGKAHANTGFGAKGSIPNSV